LPQDLIYQPQYSKETTEGSTPTTGTFTAIAPTAYFGLTSDKGAVPIMTIGKRDPNTILEGRRISGFSLRFHPYNSTFMKYAFNLGAGTGTIDDTLTFGAQVVIAGTTWYFTANHCRVSSCTITGAPGSPLLADAYVVCKNPSFDTSAPGISWASLSGTPWMFYSGGTDPVSFGSNVFGCTSISVRVDNNVKPVHVVGDRDYKQVPPGGRDFSAAVSGLFRDPTKHWTDFLGFTPGTFTWTLNSSPASAFTISSAQLVSLRELGFDVADLSVMGRYNRGGGPVEELYK
jgi:hypothetical protein